MSAFDPSNVDVEHLLDVLGIENITKATQHEMRFSCPFVDNHAGGDESPSCYMNLESSAFFCHGCKEKGTAVDFAVYVLSISPIEAVRLLKQAYQPGAINPDARDMVAEVKKILNRQADVVSQPQLEENLLDRFSMDWADAWCEYDQTGYTSFEPVTYFFDRGFEPETLMDWQFGWCERSQRIVFPIRDVDGTLIGFKGRAHDGRKPKYLVLGDGPGQDSWGFPRYFPSKVVFGAHLYREEIEGPLIVCEGELNAIAATQKTGRPAVAINGSFFQEAHAKIIRRITDDQGVILFFDDDPAGRDCLWGHWNARAEWCPGVVELLHSHMPVKIVPPQEKDAADLEEDVLRTCLEESEDQFLVRVRELVRSR